MILDTGPLVAAANRRDPDHEACRDLISGATDFFVVPAPVIAEAGFLIARAGGPQAEAAFLRSLCSEWFLVEAPTDDDLHRAADLVECYADLPLGTTDALIVATAERRHEPVIGTLDRRHFTVVRPTHVEAFELVP